MPAMIDMEKSILTAKCDGPGCQNTFVAKLNDGVSYVHGWTFSDGAFCSPSCKKDYMEKESGYKTVSIRIGLDTNSTLGK